MRKRMVWGPVAAIAALYLMRFGFKLAGEWRRYDKMLAMSNEGTVAQEFPELMVQIVTQQKQTLKEWKSFLRTAPKDLMRYLKIETM
ncbi:MAG TPA: hypothetical protein VFE17_08955 [Candidatus Baltobacteraceae bacterium]|jgi:hypothetical protein|nr:hypothetical protein [Candidatus Baltobacteraceae bacterium]